MKFKFLPAENGQPNEVPLGEDYFLACCDCGLAHLFKFQIEKGKLYLIAYRDDHLTKELRKRKRYAK